MGFLPNIKKGQGVILAFVLELHCLVLLLIRALTRGSRYELTVRNGRVVTEDSVQLADLGVNGGKIVDIGLRLLLNF